MRGSDVRIGIRVLYKNEAWTVWDKAPETGHWWIVRDGKSVDAHSRDLESTKTSEGLAKLNAALAKDARAKALKEATE